MVALLVTESSAVDELLQVGCVQTALNRRCFSLYKSAVTWTDATAGCSAMNDSRLAVIDRPDIEQTLKTALMPLEHESSDDRGYMAWTAGRELDHQLQWTWLDGRPLQGQ